MFRRGPLLALASLLVIVGCDNAQNPSAPPVELPAARISDGRHAGGNDDFFFLPPLLPNPQGLPNYNAGAFNAKLGPTVSVCLLGGNPNTNSSVDCALGTDSKPILVASFSSAEVKLGTEQYHVNWHTDDSDLKLDKFYRLQVFVGSVRLGFADIDPVSSGKDLKNANTGEVIPLVDGRTLPVKFRIENGALCDDKSDCAEFKVTQAGGTFVTNTADAGVRFAPGALPEEVSEITLTIERVRVADNRCHGGQSSRLWREYEGCYQITSDPDLREFGGLQDPNPADGIPPAIIGACVEISRADPLYRYLQPYKSHPGEPLQRLAGAEAAFLTCDGFNTTSVEPANPMLRFALAGLRNVGGGFAKVFGVRTLHAIDLGLGGELGPGMAFSRFSWGVGLEGETAGDDQETGFGLQTPEPLSVHLTSLHFHPNEGGGEEHAENIPGVDVVFTVTEGEGYFGLGEDGAPIRFRTVQTGTNGVASISFTAAANSPVNTVTASTPMLGEDDAPPETPTFSILGLPPDLVIEGLQRTPTTPNITDPLTWTFGVRNAGQGAAIPSVVRAVVRLENGVTETVASYDIPVPRLLPGATSMVQTPPLAGPHAPGAYSVTIMVNGTEVVVETNDENNTDSQDFVIRPASGNVLGSVTEAATGYPLAGASVTIVGTNFSAITDCAGDYIMRDVPSGTYTMRATFPGYAPQTITGVELSGAGTVNFALEQAPTIDGVMSEGEWAGATTYGPFTINRPNGPTTATLFVTNTSNQLFMAIRFADDLINTDHVHAALNMDENANGSWDNEEDGLFLHQRNAGSRSDSFFDFFSCVAVTPCNVRNDHEWGGTRDGTIVSTDGGRPTIIEIAKGINTDDRDATLVSGQTLRFHLFTFIGSASSSRSDFPAAPTGWASYTVR